jgi:hypothetical protein
MTEKAGNSGLRNAMYSWKQSQEWILTEKDRDFARNH